MKRAVLKWRRNQFYSKGELIIFSPDDKVISRHSINNFYEISKDFFCIYETIGGSGTGNSKGELSEKIYIGDCEYEKIFCE